MPGLTPVYLQPVMQLDEGAVEVGGCELVGNVEDLGQRLHPVGFHHVAPLRQDFICLLQHYGLGVDPQFIVQNEPRPHFPTREVVDLKRDPERLACGSGGGEGDPHTGGEPQGASPSLLSFVKSFTEIVLMLQEFSQKRSHKKSRFSEQYKKQKTPSIRRPCYLACMPDAQGRRSSKPVQSQIWTSSAGCHAEVPERTDARDTVTPSLVLPWLFSGGLRRRLRTISRGMFTFALEMKLMSVSMHLLLFLGCFTCTSSLWKMLP